MAGELHRRRPGLTFDCTVKVEHVLATPDCGPSSSTPRCFFVVSAFESVDDRVLGYLDKGHTVAEASAAVTVLRAQGIEIRPSWLPFTPSTSAAALCDLVDFVLAHDLVANVDPVQYSVRLLLPEGSLLLDHPSMAPHLGPYDPVALGWTWTHPDPAIDALRREVAALVEERVDREPAATFAELDRLLRARAGRRYGPAPGSASAGPPGPAAPERGLVLLQRADRGPAGEAAGAHLDRVDPSRSPRRGRSSLSKKERNPAWSGPI